MRKDQRRNQAKPKGISSFQQNKNIDQLKMKCNDNEQFVKRSSLCAYGSLIKEKADVMDVEKTLARCHKTSDQRYNTKCIDCFCYIWKSYVGENTGKNASQL